jgi:hypothetical protein
LVVSNEVLQIDEEILRREPRGLKPKSKQNPYRSGEPLRHPKAEFVSRMFGR